MVGWQEGHPARKQMGDSGGGHWLDPMEWRPDGWLVSASVILPCIINSRGRFLLAPAYLGSPGKNGHTTLVCVTNKSCFPLVPALLTWSHLEGCCCILASQVQWSAFSAIAELLLLVGLQYSLRRYLSTPFTTRSTLGPRWICVCNAYSYNFLAHSMSISNDVSRLYSGNVLSEDYVKRLDWSL